MTDNGKTVWKNVLTAIVGFLGALIGAFFGGN